MESIFGSGLGGASGLTVVLVPSAILETGAEILARHWDCQNPGLGLGWSWALV